ncbi:hypothetical protein DFH09DRAFT_1396669 [Mycena vulgaris]|nr:hypothetical protein DFH09DRAFT_1396669 [Mycena vulgaris]
MGGKRERGERREHGEGKGGVKHIEVEESPLYLPAESSNVTFYEAAEFHMLWAPIISTESGRRSYDEPMNVQPPTHIATETRFDNILKCFTTAVDTLEVLANTFKTPFLEPISNTSKSLLTAVQTVKQNKSDCTQLLEQTHGLLYAIVSLHMKAEAGSDLTPSLLNDLGKFTDTLYKIHTFVETQQDKSKIRHFFHQGEMSKLFKDCNLGLQEALDQFKLQDINLLTEVVVMQKFVKDKDKEVLELIEAFSDGTASDKGSLLDLNFHAAIRTKNLPWFTSPPAVFLASSTAPFGTVDADGFLSTTRSFPSTAPGSQLTYDVGYEYNFSGLDMGLGMHPLPSYSSQPDTAASDLSNGWRLNILNCKDFNVTGLNGGNGPEAALNNTAYYAAGFPGGNGPSFATSFDGGTASAQFNSGMPVYQLGAADDIFPASLIAPRDPTLPRLSPSC